MAKPRGWQVSLPKDVQEKILEDFKNGTPAAELARQHGKTNTHIYSILRRAGLRPGAHWRPGAERDYELEQRIVDAYRKRPPGGAKSVAAQFGLSYSWTLTILRRSNVPIRQRGIPEEVVARIVELKRSGISQDKIAEQSGVSQPQVSRVLIAHRFRSDPYRIGKNHGSWKGGRIIANGYVRVWLPREHRFFQTMAVRDGYVFEHRLVMAEVLGRPLLETESVHHIDGDRLNNDPKNLQIRHARHGNGVILRCRACGSHDIEASEAD